MGPQMATEPSKTKKTLVLCLDGTGNKFQGTPADSNIVKIFSLLDREAPNQFHYYQPGIGTYVESSSLARKSTYGRLRSWYLKSKDMALGSSFGEHVMAAYKFLMRFHSPGDDVYLFGFSRGAYTARFLAQMLDYVGLLTSGNEEMLRFAWKTYAAWQMRTDENAKEKAKKKDMYNFMKQFRDTFCRPIEPIRFIGLFDCVNSVPQFESAWMSRTKFPYTARSSARVIRHAVAIDERRAKFRQDLISAKRKVIAADRGHWDEHGHLHLHHQWELKKEHSKEHNDPNQWTEKPPLARPPTDSGRFKAKHRHTSRLRAVPSTEASLNDAASAVSFDSAQGIRRTAVDIAPLNSDEQDILEVWFAGQHGDIGGGWSCGHDEQPASDIALMWMVREAKKAGLPFDEDDLDANGLLHEKGDGPIVRIEGAPLAAPQGRSIRLPLLGDEVAMARLHCESRIHDSLSRKGGMPLMGCLAWNFMEHIPFRRMDLQPDGSWKPISWPLPRGEVRDIPNGVNVHTSVIRRMKQDSKYRPGNLIVGGGGRGCRTAPEHYGMGTWECVREPGHPIGEIFVKVEHPQTNGHNGKHKQ